MKKKRTIYLKGAMPVLLKAPKKPTKHQYRGILKQTGLISPERGKPGMFNPTYSQSVN